MVNLEHGIHSQSGELFHVSNVPPGLACDCLCPACKHPLVARKGKQKQEHFAHYNSGECQYARETAIHLIAKDIIAKDGIFFPKWIPPTRHRIWRYYDSLGKGNNIPEKYKLYGHHTTLDEVRIESRMGNIIPDITGFFDNEPFLIEIAVTHFADDEKYEKIVTQGVSCFEVNLDLPRRSQRDEVKDRLLSDKMWAKWIYCREGEELLDQFEEGKYDELEFLERTRNFRGRLHRFDVTWKLSKNGNFLQICDDIQFLVYWKGDVWKCKYGDIWGEKTFDKLYDAFEALRSHRFYRGEDKELYEPMDEQKALMYERELYFKGFRT